MKRLFTLILTLVLCSAICEAQPPRVPEYVSFAGKTITFDRSDLYERMDRELIAFSYMHSTSILMLKRSRRIFEVVEPILKKNGIPEDLKYLMVIESNLDPGARSPAGAVGLWQFMPATAKEYGLEVNANVDERYHIEKETEIACQYLLKAYQKFGSWINVAASYNGGMNGLANKIEQQQEDNAMDLWLVTETSRYMFRILAAKMMFEDPEAFGFHLTARDCYRKVPVKDILTVTYEIPDLVAFAKENGISYAQLKSANLWLRESKLNNASHKTYKIVIPDE